MIGAAGASIVSAIVTAGLVVVVAFRTGMDLVGQDLRTTGFTGRLLAQVRG